MLSGTATTRQREDLTTRDSLTAQVNDPTVFFVIGVHNNIRYTLECLAAIAAQDYQPIRTVVVDDGSTDGTSQKVRDQFADAHILSGDGNLWWTGCVRRGIEYVLTQARSGDYILTMNNDVVFGPDYVRQLVVASQAYGRALVGSNGYIRQTSKQSVQGGRFYWQRATTSQTLDELCDPQNPDVLHQLDYLYSRGMLIPIEAVKRVGNFNDRDLKQYRSDKEFSWRARQAGFPLIVALAAKVFVEETPGTSSLAFSTSPYISYAHAWRILTRVNSPQHLKTGLRFISLCCPPQYRERNYAMFLLTALKQSFGRTKPLAWLIQGWQWMAYGANRR